VTVESLEELKDDVKHVGLTALYFSMAFLTHFVGLGSTFIFFFLFAGGVEMGRFMQTRDYREKYKALIHDEKHERLSEGIDK